MITLVTKEDLEEWEKRVKREIYEEVEAALTVAAIVQAPQIPKAELGEPKINLFPEGSTHEAMDKIEEAGRDSASLTHKVEREKSE